MAFHKVGDKVVRPQDLCFTQESICVTFKRPREQERIDDAVDLIIQGRLSPKAFPRMNVVQFQDRLWSLDNRRLWVFKKAEVSFITVTIVTYDFGDGLHSLMSTSPYLYYTLSKRDFFPRIRGLCKEIFTEEDPEEPPSPPLPPTPRVRVPKAYSKSEHLGYDDQHHRRPHHPSHFNVQNLEEQSVPRMRGSVISPPPFKKHGPSNHGPSPPQSNKRLHQTERHHSRTSHEVRSPPPAKKSRASSPLPAWTPFGESSSPPPAKQLRDQVRGFRTPPATQKAPIPVTPHQRPKAPRPPAKESRAPSSTRKADSPSLRMKPGTAPRSLEKMADRSGNLPSCGTTEPKVLCSREKRPDRQPSGPSRDKYPENGFAVTEPKVLCSREKRPDRQPSGPSRDKHPENGFAVPTVSKEKRAERDRETTSVSRVVENAKSTPAQKKSKIPKPMNSPPNFSYDFHSSGKRSRAPKGSKKTAASGCLSTKSSSTRMNDAPLPSPASPKTRHAKLKMSTAPLPSLSTTASPSTTTKRKERGDAFTADLPLHSTVPDPKSPPATSKKSHQELNSGTSPTTKARQESPALVDGEIMTQTESNLFTLDKQAPAVDPEFLHLTPCKELSPQDRQTLDAIVELFLRDARSPLRPVQTKPTVETQTEQTEAVISPHQLPPFQMPTDAVCVKPQQEEPKDVSVRVDVPPSVVECPVKYDRKGQLFESTLKVLGPLSNPAKTCFGDGGRQRATGNVDVTVTTDLEPPAVQSTPVSGRQVEETQPETKGNATDHQLAALAQGTKVLSRRGSHDMAWIEKDEVTTILTKPIQEFPTPGNDVQKVSRRITRSQIKKHKEMEKRKARRKSKEKEREAKMKESEAKSSQERERAAKAKKEKESEAKCLQKEKSKKIVTTDIVPYNPERTMEAFSGMGTVQNGDMLYVKVDAEFTGCGTVGLKKSQRSKVRLHPYLRIIGPFAVQRRYNAYAVVLDLPGDCDLKPVFSQKALLKSRSPLDNQLPDKRVLVKLEPETILHKRMARRLKRRKVLHYLVKWKTLPSTEATWESETIFDEYPQLLDHIDDCPLFPNPFLHRNWRA